MLFHIARSKNYNIICYQANVVDGKLDTTMSVDHYWYSIDGDFLKSQRKKGITNDKEGCGYIEDKLAYGCDLLLILVLHCSHESFSFSLSCSPVDNNETILTLVALPSRPCT